ncbi:putative ribonuclease H-like domain-containing protein, partial [Tanacetum coccineum]
MHRIVNATCSTTGGTAAINIRASSTNLWTSSVSIISTSSAWSSHEGQVLSTTTCTNRFLYLLFNNFEVVVEVYVTQPPGFKDTDHPNKVYKVVKALYGLHQAPRAWYKTLANYLLSNGFKRGKIDQTLFIKKQKGDILLVQVYVDDIIFGSTNKDLCTGFEKLMKDKFQMSSMGELTFFLGLLISMDKSKITRKQSKTSKHGHENQKSTKPKQSRSQEMSNL